MLIIAAGSISYQNQFLFNYPRLVVSQKKARIALIGNNGTGKTTFFQQILTAIRTGHSQLQVTGNVAYVPQIPMDQADLSGREQTKALIVKALQQKPAVLLLDEPSANLDPQQQQWLKQELQHFSGIVLLISHDLNLLNLATEIWSVEQHQLTVVKGNYAKFKQQRARQLHKQESLYQQQQKEVHRLQQQIAKRQQQAQRMKKVNGNKLSFSEKKANSLSGHFDKGEKNYKKVLLLCKNGWNLCHKLNGIKRRLLYILLILPIRQVNMPWF